MNATNVTDLRAGPVATAIRSRRLIIVLRRVEPQSELLALVGELADAGARIFEVTFDAPSAADDLRALRRLVDARRDGDYVVGAGTLLTAEQLEGAKSAGADFGVSPVLDLDMIDAAAQAALPFVPAAMTPTEMLTAWSAGATFVKLFPALAVGPQFVRELRGPLPQIQVITTGGIDGQNALPFLEAGAVAVGIGGAIVRADSLTRRIWIETISQAP